jgi:adenylosuccinate lyase
MVCWESKVQLRELIEKDDEIVKILSGEELDEVFSYERYLRHVGCIFERCGV